MTQISRRRPKNAPESVMADRKALIARMEQIHQEYNHLSQYLMAQPQQALPGEGLVYRDIIHEAQSKTEDGNAAVVKKLSTQLQELAAEKGALEKALQEQKNENTKVISKLNQELKDWKDDTEVLKDILKRLNEQLNRYHIKYGRLQEDKIKPITKDISHSSIYKLGALLSAYDELLLERDTTIKTSTEKLEELMLKVDSVTTENEKLCIRLEKLQTEVPLGSEDAEMVAADARLLLEEREILLEELQTLGQQKQQETGDHQNEVTRLKKRLEEYDIRNHRLSSDVDAWKAECVQLEKQCHALQAELRGTVTKQEHQLAVDECQRLFEELRAAYSQDSGNMKGKMRAARQEKKNLAEKLTDTSTHIHNLSGQVSGLKGSLSELLEDRAQLLEALVAQRKETEELSREITLRSAAVGALSQKLKEERLVWSEHIAESEGARKAARSAWKRSSKEASHLRRLIATKDDTIASLIADYRMLGLDYNKTKHHGLRQHLPKFSEG
ncbi:uncharacterized protein [Panulirus ornatus]|uniref:uncharacterized protein isoform X2 n=1 Tax=Panulirus ornatus TaxID=150431 RepID=UPI003A835C1E